MCRRRAPGEWGAIGGVALIVVGMVGFWLGLLTDLSVAGSSPIAITLAGGQAMIIGILLVSHHRLMLKTSANEQALLFQYDLGYEEGWNDREKTARPVVVDMDARRSRHEARHN